MRIEMQETFPAFFLFLNLNFQFFVIYYRYSKLKKKEFEDG